MSCFPLTHMYYNRKKYGTQVPARIRVGNKKLYLISGPDKVLALFRGSRELETTSASIRIIEKSFGSPPETRNVYERDNTGIFVQPLEGSDDLEPHNRIFYNNHKILYHHLSGNGLVELASRFMSTSRSSSFGTSCV